MPTTRQWVLYGGIGAGGIAIAAWMYERNKKQKAQTTAATQQANTAAYAYGYGMTEPYGYGQLTYQPEVYGYGLGYYGYGTTYPYGAGTGAGGTVPVAAATTNAMWSQAAVSQLTNQGYDGAQVQAALGVYLTAGTLTAEQQAIVQAAIGVEGYPPQPGPNGYPPAMHSTTVNAPPPPSTGAGNVQVPYVVGKRLDQAISIIENAGLKEHTTTLAAYGFPSRWKVSGQNPAGGKVAPGTTINCSAVRA